MEKFLTTDYQDLIWEIIKQNQYAKYQKIKHLFFTYK
jgi:hypothetical protein